MSQIVEARVDTSQFEAAMKKYIAVSPYSISEIVNSKAYYISRRAMYETPMTDRGEIVKSLGQIRKSKKQIFTGTLTRGDYKDAPLVALIVNSIRGKNGKKGLTGDKMKRAILGFIGARLKSRAFEKSGWLPAIKTLKPFAKRGGGGLPPMGSGVKQFGAPHGSASPASPGWNVSARIENTADVDHASVKVPYHVPTSNPDALIKFGGPALQRAFDNEAASMLEYVAEKQAEEARKIGIKIIGG